MDLGKRASREQKLSKARHPEILAEVEFRGLRRDLRSRVVSTAPNLISKTRCGETVTAEKC